MVFRLATAGLVAAASLVGLPTASAAEDATLTIGTTVPIENPNIWALNSSTEFSAATLQYDMMLKFGDDDLSAAPSLATGCEPSEEFTRWTCTIRDDVTWSDGTPLTSRDIAFTYRFVLDQGFPYFTSYFTKGTTFETPDDQTLVWVSPKPTRGPEVPAWVYIVPEHVWSPYVGKSNREIKQAPSLPTVASGPYVMTEATPGQSWTFERNPNFWGEAPSYAKIVFRLYTNQEAMVQALKNGEIQIADGVDSALLPAVESIPNVAVQRITSDWWVNLAFNFGGQDPASAPLPALQDLRVRKAIAMAIDKQAIVDKAYQGAAAPGETIVRPLSVYWHLDIPDDQVIPFDPAAANALLDEAGYAMGPDGLRVDPATGEPLVIRLPTSNDTQGSEAAGKLIASFLAQIGIEVKVQPVSAGKMYDIQQSGDFDAYIWYWSGDPDPNYQLSVFTSAACGDLADGCWRDPVYDALFEEQAATLDQQQRQAIVHEAQRYVYEQIPVIPLAYPNAFTAYRTDSVTNLTPVPAGEGYLTPSYSYTGMAGARPVEANEPSSDTSTAPSPGAETATPSTPQSGSSGIPLWVWLVGVVVLIGVLAVVVLRRRSASEQPDTN